MRSCNASDSPRRLTIDELKTRILSLGLHLKKEGAAIVSPKDGSFIDWLIDLRRVFLDRSALCAIVAEFWEKYADKPSFQIAGMETASIPLLTGILLAAPPNHIDLNALIIRKQRKPAGLGRIIEGELNDKPIVLVDDIVNSGNSIEKSRAAIAAEGGVLSEVFVVIDFRSRQGMAWRAAHNLNVISLFSLGDFGVSLRPSTSAPTNKYKQIWMTTIKGANPYYIVPKSAPILESGRIFRGTDSGFMQCVEAATGKLIWEMKATGVAGSKGIWSTPALHEGRIYFGAYNGVVYCLDAASGREIWTQSYGEWIGASALIVPKHGLLCIGLEYARPWAQGGIAAIDLQSGLMQWERSIKKFQHGSAAYWQDKDLVIWGTADHEMLALEPHTGHVVWRCPTDRSVKCPPAIDEQRSITAFASFDKHIYLLDLKTGFKLGQWETGEICYTTPLIHNGRIFCGSGDRHLHIIDIDRRERIKTIDFGARIYCPPRLIDGNIMFGTNGGRVVEMNPTTFEIEGVIQLPDAVTNAIAFSKEDNRIFIPTYMNHLYCFECM